MNKKGMFVVCSIIVLAIIVGGIVINHKTENSNMNHVTLFSVSAPNESGDGKIRKTLQAFAAIDEKNMIEIKEKYFIQSTNDVFLNINDYIGKSIKMQGWVYTYKDNNGDICYAVVRNTPGCCGSDGLAGLDIRYAGEYPEEGVWVEVTGIVGTDNVFDKVTPAIYVYNIEVTEMGQSFVTN
ncbi:MAG: hypothetical protein IJ220_00095 [Clostridia bacterium]|nr:hypothetical protein [Clostridia bacterium]